ncbi:MAG: methyltransferase domain-containing protein [Candidatus Nanoarchaeia archaeon]|nr:methyltransferase domain-containing protein [Candidatus Nanoarchaeia archaeon]
MNLKESLKSKLSKKEFSLVPRAFDQIGNVAIFSEFPKELKKKEKLIGDALIKTNNQIKTVAIKTEKHSGKFRTKKVRIIAGEKTKETNYKENGVTLRLDVEKCYFSPRTGSERLRIANLVKKGESVLVLFSGIAPFVLTIAKNSKAREIYGIEINPTAHKYAEENVKLNKVKNVFLYKGDVRKILPKLKKFDRVLMPHPTDAASYLVLALKHLKKNGILHFYDFQEEGSFDKAVEKIKKKAKGKVLRIVKCGDYGPRIYRICVDFRFEKVI